jgi:hypothetical protein
MPQGVSREDREVQVGVGGVSHHVVVTNQSSSSLPNIGAGGEKEVKRRRVEGKMGRDLNNKQGKLRPNR